MTETYIDDSTLNALSGTEDTVQGVKYPGIYEAPYYLSFYKMLNRLLLVCTRAGDLRVYQDGDLTFGVRAGSYLNGNTLVSYSAVTGQSLTDDKTNYIYLTAAGALTKNTTGFPTPSSTSHVRLATIVAASGAITSVTDNRATAMYQPQTVVPMLDLSGIDDADGTGTVSIVAKDYTGGNALANRYLMRVWIAEAEYSEPDAQTDFSVTIGEEMRELEANADYEVISNGSGAVTMNIDTATDKTVYVMAEIAGRIYTGSVAITGN